MEEKAKDALSDIREISSWYRAKVANGGLTIYWIENDKERSIELNREETGNLLDLMYENRDDILRH